jgi:hypothetical protein
MNKIKEGAKFVESLLEPVKPFDISKAESERSFVKL